MTAEPIVERHRTDKRLSRRSAHPAGSQRPDKALSARRASRAARFRGDPGGKKRICPAAAPSPARPHAADRRHHRRSAAMKAIFRATAILGSASVINILIGIISSKVTALLLG